MAFVKFKAAWPEYSDRDLCTAWPTVLLPWQYDFNFKKLEV